MMPLQPLGEVLAKLFSTVDSSQKKASVEMVEITKEQTALNCFVAVRNLLEGPGLTKAQKLCYCLALVGGRYGWARLQMLSAFQRWGDYERVSTMLTGTSGVCKSDLWPANGDGII